MMCGAIQSRKSVARSQICAATTITTLRGDPKSRVSVQLQTYLHDLAARYARVVQEVLALRSEGAGNAGCTLHPRGLACKNAHRKRTRAYRYSRSIPAFPAQWFYGLCRAPRRRIRLVTVIGGLKVLSGPVGLTKTSADLTPATDARTTRFCRPRLRRSSVAPSVRSQT